MRADLELAIERDPKQGNLYNVYFLDMDRNLDRNAKLVSSMSPEREALEELKLRKFHGVIQFRYHYKREGKIGKIAHYYISFKGETCLLNG